MQNPEQRRHAVSTNVSRWEPLVNVANSLHLSGTVQGSLRNLAHQPFFFCWSNNKPCRGIKKKPTEKSPINVGYPIHFQTLTNVMLLHAGLGWKLRFRRHFVYRIIISDKEKKKNKYVKKDVIGQASCSLPLQMKNIIIKNQNVIDLCIGNSEI
jgi:hypothetical protein